MYESNQHRVLSVCSKRNEMQDKQKRPGYKSNHDHISSHLISPPHLRQLNPALLSLSLRPHQPHHTLIIPHPAHPHRIRNLAPTLLQPRSDPHLHPLDGLQHRAGLFGIRVVAVNAVVGADGGVSGGEDEGVGVDVDVVMVHGVVVVVWLDGCG